MDRETKELRAYLKNGKLLLKDGVGNIDQAIQSLTEAIKRNSHFALAYYYRGNAYLLSGNVQRCMTDYRKTISLEPSFVPPLQAVNDCPYPCLSLDRRVKAMYMYTTLVTSGMVHAFAHFYLANLYKSVGNLTACVLELDCMQSADEEFIKTYMKRHSLGIDEQRDFFIDEETMFFQLPFLRAIDEAMHKSEGEEKLTLKANDQLKLTQHSQSTWQSVRIDVDAALLTQYFDLLVNITKESTKVRWKGSNHWEMWRGLLKREAGQLESALVDLEAFPSVESEHYQALLGIGHYYVERVMFQTAIKYYKQAHSELETIVDPDENIKCAKAFSLACIAAAMRFLGDHTACGSTCRQALQLNPSCSLAMLQTIFIALMEGDLHQVRDLLSLMIYADTPKNPLPVFALDHIYPTDAIKNRVSKIQQLMFLVNSGEASKEVHIEAAALSLAENRWAEAADIIERVLDQNASYSYPILSAVEQLPKLKEDHSGSRKLPLSQARAKMRSRMATVEKTSDTYAMAEARRMLSLQLFEKTHGKPTRCELYRQRAVFWHYTVGLLNEAFADYCSALRCPPEELESALLFGVYDGRYQIALRRGHIDLVLSDVGNMVALHDELTEAESMAEFLDCVQSNTALFISLTQARVDRRNRLARARMHKGMIFFKRRDLRAALSELEAAQQLDNNFHELHKIRGMVLSELGMFDDAVPLLRMSLVHEPSDTGTLLLLANIFAKTQEYQEALDHYNRALAINPDLSDARLGRANIYVKLSDQYLESALVDYILYLKEYPLAWQVVYFRGVVYQKLGRFRLALTDYQSIRNSGLAFPGLLPNLAYVFQQLSMLDSAISVYDQVIVDSSSKHPTNPDLLNAYTARGRLLTQKAIYDRALDDFTHVLTVNPRHIEALFGRACLYSAMNDTVNKETPLDVLTDLNAVIEMNPQHAGALMKRCAYYFSHECYKEASIDCETLLRFEQSNAEALGQKALLLLAQNQKEEAWDLLNSAIKLDDQNPKLFLYRGCISVSEKRLSAALDDFASSLDLLSVEEEAESTDTSTSAPQSKSNLRGSDDTGRRHSQVVRQELLETTSSRKAKATFWSQQNKTPGATAEYKDTAGTAANPVGLGAAPGHCLDSTSVEPSVFNLLVQERTRLVKIDDRENNIMRATLHNLVGMLYQGHAVTDYDSNRAVQHFHWAIDLDPHQGQPFYNLGNIHLQRLEFKVAVEMFRKAAYLMPGQASAHNNLGLALQFSGEVRLALDSFRTACHLDPFLYEAHCNVGNCLTQLSRYNDALKAFDDAIALKTGDKRHVYNWRGTCHFLRGDLPAARHDFDAALKISKDDTQALVNRCQTSICDFNLDAAAADLKKLKEKQNIQEMVSQLDQGVSQLANYYTVVGAHFIIAVRANPYWHYLSTQYPNLDTETCFDLSEDFSIVGFHLKPWQLWDRGWLQRLERIKNDEEKLTFQWMPKDSNVWRKTKADTRKLDRAEEYFARALKHIYTEFYNAAESDLTKCAHHFDPISLNQCEVKVWSARIQHLQGNNAAAVDNCIFALRTMLKCKTSERGIALAHFTYCYLGWLLEEQGTECLSAAIDCYSRAIKLIPNGLEGWMNRANLHRKLKKFDPAMDDYVEVLRIMAEDAKKKPTATVQRKLYEVMRKYEQCVQKYTTSLEAQDLHMNIQDELQMVLNEMSTVLFDQRSEASGSNELRSLNNGIVGACQKAIDLLYADPEIFLNQEADEIENELESLLDKLVGNVRRLHSDYDLMDVAHPKGFRDDAWSGGVLHPIRALHASLRDVSTSFLDSLQPSVISSIREHAYFNPWSTLQPARKPAGAQYLQVQSAAVTLGPQTPRTVTRLEWAKRGVEIPPGGKPIPPSSEY